MREDIPEKLLPEIDISNAGVVKNRISGRANMAMKIHNQIFCVFVIFFESTLVPKFLRTLEQAINKLILIYKLFCTRQFNKKRASFAFAL